MISITPEGVVLKDGEQLGHIDGDTMTHHAPVGGVVKGQIRKAAQNSSLEFKAAEVGQTGSVEVAINPLSIEELKAVAAKFGLAVTDPSPGIAAIASHTAIIKTDDIVQPGRPPRPALEWLLERANKGEIPQPPPMGSEGDKTPAFIRWFKQHATPEEFEIQYGGRKYSLDPTPKQSTKLPGEFYES